MHLLPFRSAAIILCLALVAFASESRAQDLSGSMKFGPGLFTLVGEDGFTTLPNLAAVGTFRFTFGDFVLQPEVQVSTRGGAYRESFPRAAGESTVRIEQGITYLDIPLLAGVTLGGPFMPTLVAGPYGGFRVDSQVRFEFENGGGFAVPLRSTNRLDAGFIAATSAEFDTRFYRIIVELRGIYGLAPVFTDDPSMRHLGAMLLVGIAL
jgi:hypothetical protein